MARAVARSYLTPSKIALLAGLLGAAVAAWWFRDRIDLGALHDHARGMSGTMVVLGLCLLPLAGFPVAVLQAITGAKFGLPLGMAVVGGSILFHLAVTYLLVHAAPTFFSHRFKALRERLPHSSHRNLTLFTMFLPGAPYFAQNYALAIAGVPLRTFLGYCVPIHFTRSFIGVIFGEWSGSFTPGRVAVVVAYNLVITLVCALAFRRLRAQLRSRPPAAGGRKQPA
jgi:uncharacterized membrane protein YdjX (TVP38/TMEM64 family)